MELPSYNNMVALLTELFTLQECSANQKVGRRFQKVSKTINENAKSSRCMFYLD